MMNAQLLACVAGLTLLTTVLASPATAGQGRTPVAFEADVVTTVTMPDGQEHSTMTKIFQGSDGSVREDSKSGSRIVNRRTNRVAMLDHSAKVAYEEDASVARRPATSIAATGTPRRVSKIVDGRAVWQQVVEVQPGMTAEVWIDVETGAAVYTKITAASRTMTKTMRNIRHRAVPLALFDPPAHYARAQIPVRGQSGLSELSAELERTRRPQY